MFEICTPVIFFEWREVLSIYGLIYENGYLSIIFSQSKITKMIARPFMKKLSTNAKNVNGSRNYGWKTIVAKPEQVSRNHHYSQSLLILAHILKGTFNDQLSLVSLGQGATLHTPGHTNCCLVVVG